MDSNEIIDYVVHTPSNSNPNVMRGILEKGSSSSMDIVAIPLENGDYFANVSSNTSGGGFKYGEIIVAYFSITANLPSGTTYTEIPIPTLKTGLTLPILNCAGLRWTYGVGTNENGTFARLTYPSSESNIPTTIYGELIGMNNLHE